MLDKIDFDVAPITKEEYKPVHDELVKRLVVLQQEANSKGIGLVVLFEGWDGAGKGGRISDLLYNLDARATGVHVTESFDTETAKRLRKSKRGVSSYFPMMQQFWSALGPRGNMTIYDRGWYRDALQRLVYGDPDRTIKDFADNFDDVADVRSYLDSTRAFERQLFDDGYIVVKFFLHISKRTQRKRLKGLASDPQTSWRVEKRSLDTMEDYDEKYKLYEKILPLTNYDFAPWVVLNGEDRRRANLGIARTLVAVLDDALHAAPDPEAVAAAAKAAANSAGRAEKDEKDERSRTPEEQAKVREKNEAIARAQAAAAPERSERFVVPSDHPTLTGADYHLRLAPDAYKRALKKEQDRLFNLEMEMYVKRVPLILMYEGQDAAGKGGNIKRVAQALDARAYTIFPSPAPTKPELMHPFLWRYWTRLPKAGHVGIYDRSWYGRVLVERVEGFASSGEVARAYDEINEFERDLVDWGAILLKFWVEIDREEQMRRFEARAADPSKQWKITDEDWRNRDKYPQYREAVEDMFRLTSTDFAPWIILESNDKHYARVKALRIINDALEKRLHG
ncbi:polyphosphate--AMP phosphotransferase [Curtanaerobium respiraculi]|uniref:polyphosphate--AMP phosphotransferase n=1 Tax=Curtanaerobium respiraculi TaxID=2949669 RepID=UPI0024B3203D|nr:polyphosphate--AMP phosphotransferase [Curtanaerobium respiraculi]